MGQRGHVVPGCFEGWRAKAHEAEIGLLIACRRKAAERHGAWREQSVRIIRKLAREHGNFGLAIEHLAARARAVAAPRMLAGRRYAENAGKRCTAPPHPTLARRAH